MIIKKLVNAEQIVFRKPNDETNKISGLFNDELFFIELDLRISYQETLSRLIKTKNDLEPQIKRSLDKVKNQNFLEKAPQAVIEKEKNKLMKLNEAQQKPKNNLKLYKIETWKNEMLTRIIEEIKSIFERDPAARNAPEVILCYPGFQAVLIYRLSNIMWKAKLKLIAYYG